MRLDYDIWPEQTVAVDSIFNGNVLRLDATLNLSVISASTSAAPGSPAEGDVYILPTGETWSTGTANQIVIRYDGVWYAYTPKRGQIAHINDTGEIWIYTGSAWEPAHKRLPYVQTVTSSATVTPNADKDSDVIISAQAAGLTLAAPTGTPRNMQELTVAIKDNGGSQTLTFNAAYAACGVTLPAATTAGKWLYLGLRYNSTAVKWHVISLAQEA